jgi:hypothetical protein
MISGRDRIDLLKAQIAQLRSIQEKTDRRAGDRACRIVDVYAES